MFKDDFLADVLLAAFISPFKLQSDFARHFDQEVACLACMGLISTQQGPLQFGRKWRITGTGIDKLRKLKLL